MDRIAANQLFKRKAIIFICYFFLCTIALCKLHCFYELLPKRLADIGIIVTVCFFTVFVVFYHRIYRFITRYLTLIAERSSVLSALLFVFFLSFGIKVLMICLFHIDSLSHPDINVYVVTADEMNKLGKAVTYGKYCMDFPHMFWFAYTLRPVIALFGINSDALSFYMAFISSVSLLFIFDTLRRTISEKCGLVVCIFLSLLPSQILLPGFIVHEQMLTFFLCLSLWFLIGISKANSDSCLKKWLIFFCGALTLAFSIQVNFAGMVAAIAFCIVILQGKMPEDWPNHRLERGTKVFVIIIMILLVGKVCALYQNSKTELPSDYIKTDRFIWNLYVGSNAESKGQWNEEDTVEFRGEEGQTEQELRSFRKKLLLDRYTSLAAHPKELVQLAGKKYAEIWSGFFYSCSYANELIHDSDLQEFYHRFLFKPFCAIDFGLGFLMLLFCLAAPLYRIREIPGILFFSLLYIMGITAMLLLTECNQKYTITAQTFFVMTCMSLIEISNLEKEIR